MKFAIPDAEHRLAELVRRAAAGEDVVLVGGDDAAVRLVPIAARATGKTLIDQVRALQEAAGAPAADAARSQDFLYDAKGLPG